jgi:hypothetical protein
LISQSCRNGNFQCQERKTDSKSDEKLLKKFNKPKESHYDFSDDAIKNRRFASELGRFLQKKGISLYDLKDFSFDDLHMKNNTTAISKVNEHKLKIFVDNVTLLLLFPTNSEWSEEQKALISKLNQELPGGASLKPAGS